MPVWIVTAIILSSITVALIIALIVNHYRHKPVIEHRTATELLRVQVLDSVIHEVGNCANSLLPMIDNIQYNLNAKGCIQCGVKDDFKMIYELLNRIVDAKYDASVFSQLVGGKTDYVNLNECVNSCWRVFRFDKRMSGVDMKLSLSDEIGAVQTSSAAIMSILTNLISNSLDAIAEKDSNDDKYISVSTFISGRKIALRVVDSGIGIKPENIKQVTAAHFTTKKKGKGTGLGLYVISELMQSLGGRLEIESQENIGTTISVYFPEQQA